MSRGSIVILPPGPGHVTDPYRRRSRRQNSITSRLTHLSQVYHLETRCCRVEVLLVSMQTCLGVAIVVLGFYMQYLSSSLLIVDCPFWSGVPVRYYPLKKRQFHNFASCNVCRHEYRPTIFLIFVLIRLTKNSLYSEA